MIKLPNKKKSKKSSSSEEVTSQNRQKTAQQWIPISDIDGFIVYRKDNLLVSMLRIQPQNLELLSDKEKKRKVDSFAEQLNGETEDLQIFCIGRPVDLNNYLDWLQEKAKMEQDYTRKAVLKGYIQQASYMASSGETMERRFYMIIIKKMAEKAEIDLRNRVTELQNKLSQAEIISHICNDDEIMDVYSLFAHPIQASFEKVRLEMLIPPILEV
ncbi:MAG: hypothetical protein AB7G87_01235 [Clostridia bacterium]